MCVFLLSGNSCMSVISWRQECGLERMPDVSNFPGPGGRSPVSVFNRVPWVVLKSSQVTRPVDN